jgi:hypothetical protein
MFNWLTCWRACEWVALRDVGATTALYRGAPRTPLRFHHHCRGIQRRSAVRIHNPCILHERYTICRRRQIRLGVDLGWGEFVVVVHSRYAIFFPTIERRMFILN